MLQRLYKMVLSEVYCKAVEIIKGRRAQLLSSAKHERAWSQTFAKHPNQRSQSPLMPTIVRSYSVSASPSPHRAVIPPSPPSPGGCLNLSALPSIPLTTPPHPRASLSVSSSVTTRSSLRRVKRGWGATRRTRTRSPECHPGDSSAWGGGGEGRVRGRSRTCLSRSYGDRVCKQMNARRRNA